MQVDRYERDGIMAYHKNAAGGELLISAPVGSHEANSMDDAAARLLAAQAAHPAGYVRRERDTEHSMRDGTLFPLTLREVEESERPMVVERRPKGSGRRGGSWGGIVSIMCLSPASKGGALVGGIGFAT